MKSSFLAVFFFGAAIAACSGTSDKTGAGGDGGEEVTTSTGSSSSSGMGGEGGNGGGGGGAGGSAPMIKADKLGQVCNSITPCPTGYICLLLGMGATSGFCTIPCTDPSDMTTCSAANGFAGPGAGRCALTAQTSTGMMSTVCGVFCGAQFNLPDACPTGLMCQDKFDAGGMPGTDGKNDFCSP